MLPYNTEKSIMWHLNHITISVTLQPSDLLLYPILPGRRHDITEKVYTQRDIQWLKSEIEKIK